MNLTINTSTAVSALNYVMPACSSRSTLPVLQNLLLEPVDDELRITASNTEIQLTATTSCQWSEQGAITVEGKKLADIFKSLPPNTEATVSLSKDKLIVKQGRSRFSLRTIAADEFPEFNVQGEPVSFEVPSAPLRTAIEKCAPAMAKADVRYFLNGMYFAASNGELMIVGTDSHRMGMYKMPVSTPSPIDFIVPFDAVKLVSSIISGESTTLTVTGNCLSATNQGTSITVKLVDGKFPDVNRLLNAKNEITAEFNVSELSSALHRARLLANEKFKAISLAMKPGECIVSGRGNDETAEEIIACALDGTNEFDIGFNADYLKDAISHVDAENVVLNIGTETSAMIIEDGDFTALVMPQRI